MRTIRTIFILSFVCVIITGCGSSTHYTISPKGDQTVVFMRDNSEIECEMISLYESKLIISPINKATHNYLPLPSYYYYLKLEDIDSIAVTGISPDGWGTSVVLFQLIPAGLLAIAAASAEADALSVFAISSIPAIFTSLLFLGSDEETPGCRNNQGKKDFEKMKLYCRYPRELSEAEIMTLLGTSGQKALIEYKF